MAEAEHACCCCSQNRSKRQKMKNVRRPLKRCVRIIFKLGLICPADDIVVDGHQQSHCYFSSFVFSGGWYFTALLIFFFLLLLMVPTLPLVTVCSRVLYMGNGGRARLVGDVSSICTVLGGIDKWTSAAAANSDGRQCAVERWMPAREESRWATCHCVRSSVMLTMRWKCSLLLSTETLSLYALPLFYSFSFLLLARLMIFLLW